MDNNSPIRPEIEVGGVLGCVDSFVSECNMILLNEALGLSICCIQSFFIVRRKKLISRKQLISILMMLSVVFYMVYNLSMKFVVLKYFEQYFTAFYQIYMLYYFGMKICNNKLTIQLYFYGNVVFGTGILIYLLFQQDKHTCLINIIALLRTCQLFSQIIFAIIANKLCTKINAINTQVAIFDKYQAFIYTESNRRVQQLKFLTIVNLFSAILLLIINIVYWINTIVSPQTTSCRVLAHQGSQQHNTSDSINSILSSVVDLFAYYIPFMISIVIFNPNRAQRRVSAKSQSYDIEPIEQQFFSGLSIRQ